MKGKDPHFGSETSLYKLQEQMLGVAGPLTCLWAERRKIAWIKNNRKLKLLATEEYEKCETNVWSRFS